MGQTLRTMPVRADRWKPQDPIFDTIIRRCIRNAESDEANSSNTEYMAGAMVLVLLFVLILMAAKSVQAAIVVPALIAVGGFIYVAAKSNAPKADRRNALNVIGGPGRLPAGYLVHPGAWQAGLAEHVHGVPESQLQAAAEMCNRFQGTVDDLMTFTATVSAHLNAGRSHPAPLDLHRRVHEIVRIGDPILAQHNDRYPPKQLEAAGKGKKKK